MEKSVGSRFRTQFSKRIPVVLRCDDATRTQQQFRDECDLNVLMARYVKTGTLPQSTRKALYGDFTTATDYQEAQNTILHARDQFAALPAKVRDRFKNSPAEFLSFVANPKNLDEMATLGLLSEEAVARRASAAAPRDAESAPPEAG